MVGVMAVGVGVMAVGTVLGALSGYSAGQAAEAQAEYNAAIGRLQAAQVLEMAEHDVSVMREQEEQIYSAQTAAFAGQGVDLGSDIVEQTTRHTELVIAEDIATLRNNARLKAWGLEAGAVADITAGGVAAAAGISQAAGTLLSGFGNAMFMSGQIPSGA